MLKIKNIVLLILIMLVISGCKDIKDVKIDENKSYITTGSLITFCDKKYGVEYIIYSSGHRGGITVRLDEEGNVIPCGDR